MSYVVYCHENKINGKKYIGITSQKPEYRWNSGKGYKTQYFRRAIEKHGWDNFSHEILFAGLTEAEAKEKEKYFISKWNLTNPEKGYNVTEGGEGTHGYHHTKEAKHKMSIAKKGISIPAETRQKMSAALKGREKADATKQKMSEYAKNRSKEHKEKLRLSSLGNKGRRGRHNTAEQKRAVGIKNGRAVRCIETGEIYFSCEEAGRVLGLRGIAIARVARGERNRVGGLHFKYIGENE